MPCRTIEGHLDLLLYPAHHISPLQVGELLRPELVHVVFDLKTFSIYYLGELSQRHRALMKFLKATGNQLRHFSTTLDCTSQVHASLDVLQRVMVINDRITELQDQR